MPRTRYGDLRDTFHLSRLKRNDLRMLADFFSILLDAWGFHPSCKVDIHLLFFAAPSDSRNIHRSSSKE